MANSVYVDGGLPTVGESAEWDCECLGRSVQYGGRGGESYESWEVMDLCMCFCSCGFLSING